MLKPNLLRSLPEAPPPILTVYLDTNRAEVSNRNPTPGYMVWLRSKANALSASIPSKEKKLFLEQLKRVEELLHTHGSSQRGLAIFAGPKTWEIVALQINVRNELSWGRPSLSQLLWLMDEHRSCGIVVVIQKGARFYLYWLGELVELEEKEFASGVSEWKKKEIGKFARTGTHMTPGVHMTRGSQHDVFDHRMSAQYQHFYREVAQGMQLHWPDTESSRAVFVVGLEDMAKGILEELPEAFRGRVVPVREDLGWNWISRAQLQRRLEPKIEQWEREREVALVDALLDCERGAVLGIDETLVCLQQGTARNLVVEHDLDADLHQCKKCGWVDRVAGPSCTVCGGERQPASLREELPGLVRRFGTAIEIVAGEAARKLHEVGGMGSWLRQTEHVAELAAAGSSRGTPAIR
jgi:hypothetical protein